MSLDLNAAKQKAFEFINQNEKSDGAIPCAIVETKITRDTEGWYFPYQSVDFLATGDINVSLVGNWPIFVSYDGLHVGPRRPQN